MVLAILYKGLLFEKILLSAKSDSPKDKKKKNVVVRNCLIR